MFDDSGESHDSLKPGAPWSVQTSAKSSRGRRFNPTYVITITLPRRKLAGKPRITFAHDTLKFSRGRKNLTLYISALHGAARLALSRNYRRKLYRDLPRIFHAVDGKPCVNAVLLVRVNL